MHNPAGFVLLTDEKYIQYFLDTFKSDEDITYKKLNEFFGHKMDRENGKIKKIYPPVFFTSDEFILKKGTLENVKKDIQTSIGLYIFNLFCLNSIFKDRIDYFNPEEGLNPNNVEKIVQIIVDMIIENKANGEEFAQFQNRFNFLGYKGTLWTPGQSFEFAKINPEVAKNKPILMKKWKEAVAEGADPVSSYVLMVEKPLLKIIKRQPIVAYLCSWW